MRYVRKNNCTVCGSPVYMTLIDFDNYCVHCNCGDRIYPMKMLDLSNWDVKK